MGKPGKECRSHDVVTGLRADGCEAAAVRQTAWLANERVDYSRFVFGWDGRRAPHATQVLSARHRRTEQLTARSGGTNRNSRANSFTYLLINWEVQRFGNFQCCSKSVGNVFIQAARLFATTHAYRKVGLSECPTTFALKHLVNDRAPLGRILVQVLVVKTENGLLEREPKVRFPVVAMLAVDGGQPTERQCQTALDTFCADGAGQRQSVLVALVLLKVAPAQNSRPLIGTEKQRSGSTSPKPRNPLESIALLPVGRSGGKHLFDFVAGRARMLHEPTSS